MPDISVFHGEEPTESVPAHPPLVAIEINSPDDSMNEVRGKLQDYSNWGVAHVWLIDPHSQRLYTCDGELREVRELTIPERGTVRVAVDLPPGTFERRRRLKKPLRGAAH